MPGTILAFDTVSYDGETDEGVLIDQTKLPNETAFLRISDTAEMEAAIRRLSVRGAPAIGVAAALGLADAERRRRFAGREAFDAGFSDAAERLAASRPTAVNLRWAVDRMERAARANPKAPPEEIGWLLLQEAKAILGEDIAVCRRIGEIGLGLIHDGAGILTHCNAGKLAAVRYGTALAPVHLGAERGMRFRVYVDETRPLLQGARLTAFEMLEAGMETTLLCDNMACDAMKRGWIDAVFVGCDRVAANGDTANKIGTSSVAVLAKHFGIPFYVMAPTSTVDPGCAAGKDIVIEQRPPEEVASLWYRERMTPEGVKIYNPAFDVTDHGLITAFVTEYGLVRPPFGEGLRRIFEQKRAGGAF